MLTLERLLEREVSPADSVKASDLTLKCGEVKNSYRGVRRTGGLHPGLEGSRGAEPEACGGREEKAAGPTSGRHGPAVHPHLGRADNNGEQAVRINIEDPAWRWKCVLPDTPSLPTQLSLHSRGHAAHDADRALGPCKKAAGRQEALCRERLGPESPESCTGLPCKELPLSTPLAIFAQKKTPGEP